MASNSALQFKIQFIEDSKSITDLIKRVKEKLDGTQIKLKVGDIDIGDVSGSMKKLETAIKSVQEILNKTGDVASFKGMADSMKLATESMDNLKKSLSELNSTLSGNLGTNIGNAIVQGLAQANQAIATTMANLEKMNDLASNKNLPKDINQSVNKDLALTRIAEIDKYMASIGKQLEASFKMGFDTGELNKYFDKLGAVRRELENIVKANGEGKRVDAILRDANYGSLAKNTSNEVRAVEEVTTAVEKLKTALDSLKNVGGVDALRGKMQDLLKDLNGHAGIKMFQSEHVNRYYKSLLGEANDAIRNNTRVEREQQQEQNRTAQETTRAQNTIQKEIALTRQKFDELYAAQARLREKGFVSGVDVSSYLNANQQRLTSLVEQIRQMESMLKATPQQMTAFAQGLSPKSWKQDFDAGMKTIRDGMKNVTESFKIDNILGTLRTRMQDIFQLSREAGSFGLTDKKQDLNDMFMALNKIRHELEAIKGSGHSSKGLSLSEYLGTRELSTALSNASRVRSDARSAITAEERAIAARANAALKQNRADATNEISRLKKAMQEINAIQAKSPGIKINGVDKALQDIQRIINLLEQAKERGRSINLIQGAMGSYSAQNAPQLIAQLSQNQQAAAAAARQHEQEQQRMAAAINKATGEARQQSQALSDLRSMALQYLSVWGVSNFVKEIAQITGELELQQKSLEVIIGSAGKAQELFNDIKGMSQMSPYTFQNLLKTTRQLAAFGIETKDLYGTMKQLSDIGAGLDVDVQRLVLAYGHIKSSGVLTGIQRRQLETAGIGITAELAKMYNDQYRASGSSERVTAEDVFKRIRDRQVTFEDVEKVFNRLTGPGGKFENMQLKQYETLGGKLRNLQNNYNIMLDEIGKAHMGLLMGGVNALNSMMENWQKWADVIKTVGAGLIAVKVAQAALGKSAMAHRAATVANNAILRENAMVAATTTGWGGFWTRRGRSPLDENYAQRISDNQQMNKWQKARAVMYKNVTPAARELLLVEQGFSPAYAANAASMGRWGLMFQRLKLSAQSFFATMRAGFASLLTNPMTWIFAAVAGITALISRYKELNQAADTMRDNIQKKESEDLKSIREAWESIGVNRRRVNGTLEIDRSSINTNDIENIISSLDGALQKFDPLYRGHLFDIEQMGDEKDKVVAMIQDLDAVEWGKRVAQNKAALLAGGIESTGGVMKDTFSEELKEYEQEMTSAQMKIEQIVSHFEATHEPIFRTKEDEHLVNLGKEIKEFYGADTLTSDMLREYLQEMVNTEYLNLSYGDINFNNAALTSKITASVKKYFEGVNPAIISGLGDLRKAGDTGKAGAVFLEEMLQQIFSAEGEEIGDEKTKRNISQAVMMTIYDSLMDANPADADAFLNGAMKEWLDATLKTATEEFLAQEKSKYGDLDNVDAATLKKDFDAYFHSMLIGVQQISQLAENGSVYMDKFKESLAGVKAEILKIGNIDLDLSPWQKKIKKALALTKFDDIKTRLNIKVGADADLMEFAEAVQKAFKEAKEKAENMARTLNIGAKLGIKIDADVMFGDMTQLVKLRDKLTKYWAKNVVKPFDDQARQNANDALGMIEAINDLIDFKTIENATGYNFTDDGKGKKKTDDSKKKADEAKRKAEQAAREAERKEIEHFRTMIDLVQRLRREYKSYRELFNKDEAMAMVETDYRKQYGNNGPFKWEQIAGNIENFSIFLDDIADQIDASTKIRTQEEKDNLKRTALSGSSEGYMLVLREKSEDAVNEFNNELEKITVAFETLRKILAATGDEALAGDVSGFGLGAAAGKVSSMIQNQLDMGLGLKLGDKYKEIDFDHVASLSEKGVEEYANNLFGTKESAYLVKAVTQMLKEYRKAVKNENKDALEAYTKAISAAMDYESQVARIEQESNDAILKIRESGLPADQQQRAIGIEEAKRDMRELEVSGQYKRFFDGIFAEPLESMRGMASKIEGVYEEALRKGAITAEEYAKKIMEINDVMEKAKAESNKGWFEKGIFNTQSQEDITKKMLDAAQDKMSEGADLIQRGQETGNDALVRQGEGMQKEAQQEIDDANARARRLRNIQEAVNAVDKAIQAMNKAFNYIYEAFDALGEGEALEGIKDYMETLGNMSGHVKGAVDAFMHGDYFDMAAEGIGAVFSVITGIAQAHDNRLQRKIEKIQFETEKMNNTLDAIRSLRERQLGYDNGNMRLMLAAMYSRNGSGGDAATQAMIDYYTRYSGGSGYEQELKLLEEQRQKLLEMYNLEDAKKKKSKEDLEDYKQQIAELDQQIRYYTEDLAKELWGIDLKGWADQIGDALMTAFENGTSAASAFHDAVQDIMRGVVRNMMITGIIEPALESLREKLFGKDGKGGVFGANGGMSDIEKSTGAVLSALADWFNEDGARLMDAANEYFNGADNLMKQVLGYGLKESDRSTNTVNSIQSAASEETMGVVAGYLSRISQDVSVQRIMQEMFVNGSWPSYIEQVTGANDSLTAIDRSTTAMMEMMRDGNGALYERVENMSRRLDNFANGIDRIYIN